MVNGKRTIFLFVASWFLAFNVNAEIQIIADFGGEPIEMILADIMPKEDLPKSTPIVPEIELKKYYSYPFLPSFAEPGKHSTKEFKEKLKIVTPIVLVGTDPYSSRWFRTYKSKLYELGAAVFIVEAKTERGLKSIMASYRGRVSPLQKSDPVFKTYGITNYPVLITADGVFQ